ncbi:hypothetical protein CDAR_192271 [Caerostris darwini]|uniref:Uncharacterized protein n=1 Tax=Caerostris darwini TaxID=1538125 RepID=A0AAV4TWJ9_9ARAC|nr:hypothetical protein CDAR_192271 [Caerostris darwini]
MFCTEILPMISYESTAPSIGSLPKFSTMLELYATEMLNPIQSDADYLAQVTLNYEPTFHVCEKVTRHNCSIWSNDSSNKVIENGKNHQQSMCG